VRYHSGRRETIFVTVSYGHRAFTDPPVASSPMKAGDRAQLINPVPAALTLLVEDGTPGGVAGGADTYETLCGVYRYCPFNGGRISSVNFSEGTCVVERDGSPATNRSLDCSLDDERLVPAGTHIRLRRERLDSLRASREAQASASEDSTEPSTTEDHTVDTSDAAVATRVVELVASSAKQLACRHPTLGLRNLGNTCFMNSVLQCLNSVRPLVEFFFCSAAVEMSINLRNVLGSGGRLAKAFSALLHEMRPADGARAAVEPHNFLDTLCDVHSQFDGGEQHDAMELFDSVVDILHEDLNRVKAKETTEPVEDDGQPDERIAQESWSNHLKRNDSVITDLFQGQFKSRLTCPNKGCKKRHVRNFDVFSSVALPIPGPPPDSKVVSRLRIYVLDSDLMVWRPAMEMVPSLFKMAAFTCDGFCMEFAKRASDLNLSADNLMLVDDRTDNQFPIVTRPLRVNYGNATEHMWHPTITPDRQSSGLRLYQFPDTPTHNNGSWIWVNVYEPDDDEELERQRLAAPLSAPKGYYPNVVRNRIRRPVCDLGRLWRGKRLVTFPIWNPPPSSKNSSLLDVEALTDQVHRTLGAMLLKDGMSFRPSRHAVDASASQAAGEAENQNESDVTTNTQPVEVTAVATVATATSDHGDDATPVAATVVVCKEQIAEAKPIVTVDDAVTPVVTAVPIGGDTKGNDDPADIAPDGTSTSDGDSDVTAVPIGGDTKGNDDPADIPPDGTSTSDGDSDTSSDSSSGGENSSTAGENSSTAGGNSSTAGDDAASKEEPLAPYFILTRVNGVFVDAEDYVAADVRALSVVFRTKVILSMGRMAGTCHAAYETNDVLRVCCL